MKPGDLHPSMLYTGSKSRIQYLEFRIIGSAWSLEVHGDLHPSTLHVLVHGDLHPSMLYSTRPLPITMGGDGGDERLLTGDLARTWM